MLKYIGQRPRTDQWTRLEAKGREIRQDMVNDLLPKERVVGVWCDAVVYGHCTEDDSLKTICDVG